MNIKEAKEQIKRTITAYLEKDENGDYEISAERQRPVFLIGPPGIGKTAIMQQISQELNIGLVSYSMTHHTRQSALGLPFIVKKSFRGEEYSVTEYTMSEIIASVYEKIEKFGANEGILFLDEINCVSETLAPSMLQFLQYKTFGTHAVPEGWVIVTAGNPPEFNNSVREFDIVTWDRLKRIDIEPDFEVWKEYAYGIGVHPAITSYLEIKKNDFYNIETTVDGKKFATARGWVDLSKMIRIYEKKGFPIDESLVVQYIQDKNIAKQFSLYYDLFKKYRSDYQVTEILEGNASDHIYERAASARFDERLSLISLMLEALNNEIDAIMLQEGALSVLMGLLTSSREDIMNSDEEKAEELIQDLYGSLETDVETAKQSGMMSREDINSRRRSMNILEKMLKDVKTEMPNDGQKVFELLRKDFKEENKVLRTLSDRTKEHLDNIFVFCEKAFKNGQELVILVTELTADPSTAHFISRYGSQKYFEHNSDLLFYKRHKLIEEEIDKLDI